jgi:hypothetical protein
MMVTVGDRVSDCSRDSILQRLHRCHWEAQDGRALAGEEEEAGRGRAH